MQSRIVSVNDYTSWAAAMARVGAHDVYYSSNYHRLYSFRDGRFLAYITTIGGETLFYPFVLRPIRKVGSVDVSPGLHDIETVYGYTGPMATTAASDFLTEAWNDFGAWCSKFRVVSEFIRFNPFLRTERFASPQTETTCDRNVVEICLDLGEGELWRSYESVQRNRVRKALRNSITCEQISLRDGLPVLRHLYETTMRRSNADQFYFFPDAYYRAMITYLSRHAVVFVAGLRNKIIAAALFLHYGENVHYHLGGSCPEYLSLAPNNLLFHEAALWAQRRGFKRLHMGGGKSAAPDDSLFRFKRRLSEKLTPFHLGRRVHDALEYGRLCEIWRRQAQCPALPSSYFPPYRLMLRPTANISVGQLAHESTAEVSNLAW